LNDIKSTLLIVLIYITCLSVIIVIFASPPMSISLNDIKKLATAGEIPRELYYLAEYKHLTENMSTFHIVNGILCYPILSTPVHGKYFLIHKSRLYLVIITVVKESTPVILKVPINSSFSEFQHYCEYINCSFSSDLTLQVVKSKNLPLLQALAKEIRSFSLEHNLTQNETISLINEVTQLSIDYYWNRWKDHDSSVTITVLTESGQTEKITLHVNDEATLAVTRGGVCYDRAWFEAYLIYYVLEIPTDIALVHNNSHAIVATEVPVWRYTTPVTISNKTYYVSKTYAPLVSGLIKILWNDTARLKG